MTENLSSAIEKNIFTLQLVTNQRLIGLSMYHLHEKIFSENQLDKIPINNKF
jgi:hypothetical protein